MKQYKLDFKYLRPVQGISFNCLADKVGMQSQIQTGEGIREGYLCSGWWNKFTGQIWFKDEPVILYQKVKGGPILLSELKAYLPGGHVIIFHNLIVKASSVRGFMAAIESKFAELWSDNSEQTK